jgi:hypothetical protein
VTSEVVCVCVCLFHVFLPSFNHGLAADSQLFTSRQRPCSKTRTELAGFLCNTYLRRCDVVGSGNPECFGVNPNAAEVRRCCSNPDQEQPEDGCFAEWPQGATTPPATFDVCCTPGIRCECCCLHGWCVCAALDLLLQFYCCALSSLSSLNHPFSSPHLLLLLLFTATQFCCQAAVPQCMFAVQRGVLRLYFQRPCSRTTARILHRLRDHHRRGCKHPGRRCGRSRVGVRWLFDLENRIRRSVHERIRLPGRVSLQQHGCSAGWQPFFPRIRCRLRLGRTSVPSRVLRACRERRLRRRKPEPRVPRSVPCERS